MFFQRFSHMLMHEDPLLLLVQCTCELIYTNKYEVYVYLFHIFFGYFYSINVYKAQNIYLYVQENLHLYENVIGSAVPQVLVNSVTDVSPPPAKEWLILLEVKICIRQMALQWLFLDEKFNTSCPIAKCTIAMVQYYRSTTVHSGTFGFIRHLKIPESTQTEYMCGISEYNQVFSGTIEYLHVILSGTLVAKRMK